LLMLGLVQADAQERLRERETTTTTTRVRRGSHLIGSPVMIRGGTALGKVVDFVINEDGCIDYVIVRSEEEFVPIPWGVIRYDGRERAVTVTTDVTRDRLRSMHFREGRWPDFASEKWMRSARTVWGEKALRRHAHETHSGDRARPSVKDGVDRRDDGRRNDPPPVKDGVNRRDEGRRNDPPPAKDGVNRKDDGKRSNPPPVKDDGKRKDVPPAKDRRTDRDRPPDRRPPDRP